MFVCLGGGPCLAGWWLYKNHYVSKHFAPQHAPGLLCWPAKPSIGFQDPSQGVWLAWVLSAIICQLLCTCEPDCPSAWWAAVVARTIPVAPCCQPQQQWELLRLLLSLSDSCPGGEGKRRKGGGGLFPQTKACPPAMCCGSPGCQISEIRGDGGKGIRAIRNVSLKPRDSLDTFGISFVGSVICCRCRDRRCALFLHRWGNLCAFI